MKQPTYQKLLTISYSMKGIPYGAGPRPDGQANHGFKNLKANPALLDEVPELSSDDALRSLITAIQAPTCGLFSIGCLSGEVSEPQGFRMTGYVEIAINSRSKAEGAAEYFPLFFHTDRFMYESGFNDRVIFYWELLPAMFLDAKTHGFTCAITINTEFHATLEEARASWHRSLAALQHGFSLYLTQGSDPIY